MGSKPMFDRFVFDVLPVGTTVFVVVPSDRRRKLHFIVQERQTRGRKMTEIIGSKTKFRPGDFLVQYDIGYGNYARSLLTSEGEEMGISETSLRHHFNMIYVEKMPRPPCIFFRHVTHARRAARRMNEYVAESRARAGEP